MWRQISTILLCLIFLLNGCGNIMEPPTAQELEAVFRKYQQEFQTVGEYLLAEEDDHVTIFSGQDLKSAASDVQSAENTLKVQTGCYSIHRNGSTVTFVLWSRFMDVGCGIAYTTSTSPEPEMQYLSQLEPLSEPGWYYYVEDYNQWRLMQQEKESK